MKTRNDFVSNSSSSSFILSLTDKLQSNNIIRKICGDFCDNIKTYSEMNMNFFLNGTQNYCLKLLMDFRKKEDLDCSNDDCYWCGIDFYGTYRIDKDDLEKYRKSDRKCHINLNEEYEKFKKSEDEYFCNIGICEITQDTIDMTRSALTENSEWEQIKYYDWKIKDKEIGVTVEHLHKFESILKNGGRIVLFPYSYSGDSICNGYLWYDRKDNKFIENIVKDRISGNNFEIIWPGE